MKLNNKRLATMRLPRRLLCPITLTGLFAMAVAAAPLRAAAGQEDVAKCAPKISTRVATVQDVYHGVVVDDPYRWLEDWSNPDVRAWSDAQSECARQFLDGLGDATKIRRRLEQLLTVARGTTFFSPKFRAGRLFALRSVANMQQPSIIWLSDADASGAARLVFDPMRLDPSGSTSIDWYVPSDDGALVAVSLSSAGAERGVLHVFDVVSGKELSDAPIDNVNNATAGGDLVWSPDGSGFFYTRYPQRGERPDSELAFYQRVYYHKIGTAPTMDRYELGSELPSIAAIRLRMQKESGRVIAWVQNGDSGQFRFFLRERDGRWRPFGNFSDGHFEAAFGSGDDVFVLTAAGAPRGKVLRLSARDLDFGRAQAVVPESDAALSNSFYSKDSPTIAVSNDVMLLVYQAGGPAQLRLFSTQGRPIPSPVLPAVSTVSSLTALADSDVLFAVESFVGRRRWLRYNLKTKTMNRTLSTQGGTGDWDDAQVAREFAVSRDGTRIPVTIVNLSGAPIRGLLLTGYGGYRISITPRFEPQVRMLLEQGIAYAVANLRGGAEFGEDWHTQGSLLLKQNVFDDFIAVAKHLTDKGFAPDGKLAITGTSNGGLLMGAVLTQRPQLAQAVVSRVGVYDSLRNELDPNGVFNIPEFGTVKEAEQFRALYAYSPYHHVQKSQQYPPALFLTGANDSRVNPMHSRKMIARLQAANTSASPVLLRTSAATGHGAGTPLSSQIEELTDEYAFIMDSLALAYREGLSNRPVPATAAPASSR